MLHTFKKSSAIEHKYAYLHNQMYAQAFEKIAAQQYKLLDVNREICDYNTPEGKLWQKGDVDSIISFSGPDMEGIKKVSEKVRNTSYDDLYIEIISIFAKDKGKYVIEDLGWGNKETTDPALDKSPDYLSYICLDHKNNKYKGLFISGYKKLKKSLFFDDNAILKNLVNEDFINFLNTQIYSNNSKDSFSIKSKNTFYENIIFAKNKNHNKEYFTIGITINKKKLKELDIKVHEFQGVIKSQLKNKI